MILLIHMLFGAAVGSLIKSPPLAIILAFLSHYLLDLIPHKDYYLKDINKKWGILRSNILKILLDLCLGILFIFLFSHPPKLVIYVYAFFAILPDGFTVLNNIFSNKVLSSHNLFHEKIHFLKDKKIPKPWRIINQIIIVVISIYLLNRS